MLNGVLPSADSNLLKRSEELAATSSLWKSIIPNGKRSATKNWPKECHNKIEERDKVNQAYMETVYIHTPSKIILSPSLEIFKGRSRLLVYGKGGAGAGLYKSTPNVTGNVFINSSTVQRPSFVMVRIGAGSFRRLTSPSVT